MEFFLQERQQPSKTEYYLMRIAMEVQRVLSKDPKKIKLNDFKLSFDVKDEDPKERKRKQRQKMEQSKAAWLGSVGIKKGKK